MHILVAKDNEINAEILSKLLDMEESCCEIYENGHSCTVLVNINGCVNACYEWL